MERLSWDKYFMELAKIISTRSTCSRASVGAVIVLNNRVLTTGYNGALSGEPHCIDEGCLVVDNHCQRAIHAETNAVAQAAKFGIAIGGATLYLWGSNKRAVYPCLKCYQVMRAAGIKKVVNRNSYKKNSFKSHR